MRIDGEVMWCLICRFLRLGTCKGYGGLEGTQYKVLGIQEGVKNLRSGNFLLKCLQVV